MKIIKFNEHNEIDPYNEENWDNELFVKPPLVHDPDYLTPLFLHMDKIMGQLERKEKYMEDDFPEIYSDVFEYVVYGLYGEKGKEFIKKAWKIDE